eukprot:77702_1
MTTQQTKGKDVLDSASNLGEGKDDLDAYTASDVNNINQKIAPAYSLESNQKSKLPLPKDNANEQQYNEEKDEEEENEQQKKKEPERNIHHVSDYVDNRNKSSQYYWKYALAGGIIIGLVGAAAIGFYVYSNYYSESVLLKQNQALKIDKQELNFKNDSLKTEVKALNDKIEVYKKNNFQERDGTIEGLQELNKKHRQDITCLTSENSILKFQNSAYENTINQQKQSINDAHKSTKDIEALGNIIQSEQSKYEILESKYDILKEKLNVANGKDLELKSKTNELLTMQNTIENQQSKYQTLESKYKILKEQLNSANATEQDTIYKANEMWKMKSKIESENQELKAALAKYIADSKKSRIGWLWSTFWFVFPWWSVYMVNEKRDCNYGTNAVVFGVVGLIITGIQWTWSVWSAKKKKNR